MRGKNKSFIEDTIILFVIGIIIYAVYSFFFASDEEGEIQNEYHAAYEFILKKGAKLGLKINDC